MIKLGTVNLVMTILHKVEILLARANRCANIHHLNDLVHPHDNVEHHHQQLTMHDEEVIMYDQNVMDISDEINVM